MTARAAPSGGRMAGCADGAGAWAAAFGGWGWLLGRVRSCLRLTDGGVAAICARVCSGQKELARAAERAVRPGAAGCHWRPARAGGEEQKAPFGSSRWRLCLGLWSSARPPCRTRTGSGNSRACGRMDLLPAPTAAARVGAGFSASCRAMPARSPEKARRGSRPARGSRGLGLRRARSGPSVSAERGRCCSGSPRRFRPVETARGNAE